jgi:hypothetical protein
MTGKAGAPKPDDGWQTVADENATRIVFDTIGDEFIGTYLGHDLVNGEYDYLMFRGTDDKLYSTSCGWKLGEAFGTVDEAGKIAEGSMVRITYVKEIPMDGNRNPLKDFRVDVKA